MDKLELLQSGNQYKFCFYGNSIYPAMKHLSVRLDYGSKMTAQFKLENKAMKSERECIK